MLGWKVDSCIAGSSDAIVVAAVVDADHGNDCYNLVHALEHRRGSNFHICCVELQKLWLKAHGDTKVPCSRNKWDFGFALHLSTMMLP